MYRSDRDLNQSTKGGCNLTLERDAKGCSTMEQTWGKCLNTSAGHVDGM